jgi:hypothetical protein
LPPIQSVAVPEYEVEEESTDVAEDVDEMEVDE